MKPTYFFPFFACLMLMGSFVYFCQKQTCTATIDAPILTKIHYADLGSHPKAIIREQLNEHQVIITVPAYNGMDDLRAELNDGLLVKRSFVTNGTSLVNYYQTFRYSSEGHLRQMQTWRRDPRNKGLKLYTHDYFETNARGQIIRRSSWMSFHGKPVLKETFTWENENVVRHNSFASHGKLKTERTFRHDHSSINPWAGLNIFPEDPRKQTLNNIIQIETIKHFRSQDIREIEKFQYFADPSGKTFAKVNPVNGMIIQKFRYE
ncbi:MAG: hypothetical protein AAF587_24835 [Bacteroidota bacterium]